jgi:23S rRNA-/tRNA-specific pseudouridylate synthase
MRSNGVLFADAILLVVAKPAVAAPMPPQQAQQAAQQQQQQQQQSLVNPLDKMIEGTCRGKKVGFFGCNCGGALN